ncbi:thermonuclease family protein [Nocardioides panacis]|jgi:endonuclease YncB( thermonuclease family)|uniref:Thermonuclease family protein n=1 Tax=Nocardioides panacis TaxID=2849501 RepID=A0A975T2H6_9ACTN|nr:thermonuclease family protein [Nocardioides panacis]QWZ09684.1 thermonuclease family protein [Nocardioides panacis]
MRKTLLAVALAVIASVLVVTPAAEAVQPVRVIRWVDGDTVDTTRGTVRLIGVDTPERGKCGSAAATRLARASAPAGTVIELGNPTSVRHKDHYGRLLRYVNRGARDLSATQIYHGAWARYDSLDGYQHHPRQAKYRRLDAAHRNYCGHQNPGKTSTASKPASGGAVSAPVTPRGHNCPSFAPIKGNAPSMIYHRPGQAYYNITTPEDCFRNAASAEAAGYRAAKN